MVRHVLSILLYIISEILEHGLANPYGRGQQVALPEPVCSMCLYYRWFVSTFSLHCDKSWLTAGCFAKFCVHLENSLSQGFSQKPPELQSFEKQRFIGSFRFLFAFFGPCRKGSLGKQGTCQFKIKTVKYEGTWFLSQKKGLFFSGGLEKKLLHFWFNGYLKLVMILYLTKIQQEN